MNDSELFRRASTDPETVDPDRLLDAFDASGGSPEAMRAVESLARVAPDRVTPVVEDIVSLLGAEDSEVRSSAARTVSILARADPEAVAPRVGTLAAHLDDEALIVDELMTAVGAVAASRPTAVENCVDRIVDSVDAELPSTRWAAVDAIAHLAAERPAEGIRALPALLAFLATTESTPDEEGGIPNEFSTEVVHELEQQEELREVWARKRAATAISAVATAMPERSADAVEGRTRELLALLDDEDPNVRGAVVGLCSFVAEHTPGRLAPAVDRFVERLEDDHAPVRGSAAWTLGYLNAEAALPALSEVARSDPDTNVRAVAVEAIDRIETE